MSSAKSIPILAIVAERHLSVRTAQQKSYACRRFNRSFIEFLEIITKATKKGFLILEIIGQDLVFPTLEDGSMYQI